MSTNHMLAPSPIALQPGGGEAVWFDSAQKSPYHSRAATATVAELLRPPLTTVRHHDHVAAAAYVMKHAGTTALIDVYWVVGGLGRFADRAAGKQPDRPGGQRAGEAFCQFARGFEPLAHVDRAAQHHRVELLDRAHLLGGSAVTVQPRSASTSATAWAISLVAPYLLAAQTSTFTGLPVRMRGRCRSAGR